MYLTVLFVIICIYCTYPQSNIFEDSRLLGKDVRQLGVVLRALLIGTPIQ